MSHLWVVKGTAGYKILEHDGSFIMYPGMAADCKAYIQRVGKEYKIINEKSSDDELEEFYNATRRKYISPKENSYF